MSALGNLLWIFLGGGILISLGYLIGGLVLCVTIVGIPWAAALQTGRPGSLSLWQRGRHHGIGGRFAVDLMNVLWWVFGGVEVAIVHLVLALILAVTVVGLPFAKQHLKLLRWPWCLLGRAWTSWPLRARSPQRPATPSSEGLASRASCF